MAPHKFVIKCGNFAVLVDLHVLPLGAQVDTSWFTASHIEEVTSLVRDAVDQRVKQYAEFQHNRRQHKQKKELPMASAVVVEGKDFSLVANFLKRHISLRCIVKQVYGDLRVFPERYVVCVSCPEHSAARHGNLSRATTELSEKSRSEYFSGVGENQESSTFLTQTKKTVLQKLAKQARVQREPPRSSLQEQNIDRRVCLKNGEHTSQSGESFPETEHIYNQVEVQNQDPSPPHPTRTDRSSSPDGAPAEPLAQKVSPESRKSRKCKSSDSSEDPHRQRAKKKCLGITNRTVPPHSSERDPPSPTPHPPDQAESKAFPVSECKETTLEVELLTSGKRAQRLPLTSNNTAQTNQNRPAASLRGLSVKLASSGRSISSRSAVEEEGSENAPRASRLRRQKRS
ncbi:protein SLX4IP [Neosynchiropus ocellatus]